MTGLKSEVDSSSVTTDDWEPTVILTGYIFRNSRVTTHSRLACNDDNVTSKREIVADKKMTILVKTEDGIGQCFGFHNSKNDNKNEYCFCTMVLQSNTLRKCKTILTKKQTHTG